MSLPNKVIGIFGEGNWSSELKENKWKKKI